MTEGWGMRREIPLTTILSKGGAQSKVQAGFIQCSREADMNALIPGTCQVYITQSRTLTHTLPYAISHICLTARFHPVVTEQPLKPLNGKCCHIAHEHKQESEFTMLCLGIHCNEAKPSSYWN